MRWLDSIADLMDMSLGKLQEIVKHRGPAWLQFMESQNVEPHWATEQQEVWGLHKLNFFWNIVRIIEDMKKYIMFK